MKSRRYTVVLSLIGALLLSATVFISTNPHDDFLENRAELVVRQIGHKLLWYSGDSTSRVLPVKQVVSGVFKLEFQNQLSFMPDTLVNIVRTNLALADLPLDYMVNVYECASNDVVYGFEIRPDYKEIVPCSGREQPKGCYNIQITFINLQSSLAISSRIPWYMFTLIGLTLVAFIGHNHLKSRKKADETVTSADGVPIGHFSFSYDHRLLTSHLGEIELSYKEAKLLSIFIAQQNQLISREELLKKVWEDDGVFTGRSLDMFISKLRKKLKSDASIKITNIHGKGYMIEVKS